MKHQLNWLLAGRLDLAEKLIKTDIDIGLVEGEVRSFSSLHEYVDPNCYVSFYGKIISEEDKFLADYRVENWIIYWEVLLASFDKWLKNNMKGKARNYLRETHLE